MKVTVFDWNGLSWEGWWEHDEGEPTVYDGVHLRQLDPGKLTIGTTLSFDVPNGDDWGPEEPGLDRYIMEAATIDLWTSDLCIEGFAHVEHFGRMATETSARYEDAEGVSRVPKYRKQRWVVKL